MSIHRLHLLFLIVVLFCFGNEDIVAQRSNSRKKDAQKRELAARQNIKDLREGVLLIRLQTSEKKIDWLRKHGKKKDADRTEELQRQENLEIKEAFENIFDFCPIYFFYSNNSKKVMEGDFENIFLNDSLEEYTSLPLRTSNVFVLDAENVFLKTFNDRQSGFSVLDQQLNQLERPFPYYVLSRKGSLFFKKSLVQMVLLLNKKLKAFYDETSSLN